MKTKLPAFAEPDEKCILQYPFMLMAIRASHTLHIIPTTDAYEMPACGVYGEVHQIVEWSNERRPICRKCRQIVEDKGIQGYPHTPTHEGSE